MLINQQTKPEAQTTLYSGNTFQLLNNKVIQGDNVAEALSPTFIRSNYTSPSHSNFSRKITFKFSINLMDNEGGIGIDHKVVIKNDKQSPIIKFGNFSDHHQLEEPESGLPTNFAYTFRLDMSPVFNQFNEKGFYETWDGSRISQSDFEGVYLAGDALPLSWDFPNLDEKGLKLEPTKDHNIYVITVQLNPVQKNDDDLKEWHLQTDLRRQPSYTSDQAIVDTLFNLSLEEGIKNIEDDNTLRTGAKWGGVWTRDVSYSIFLAFGYLFPSAAKTSLEKKIKRNRIVQDTGSGGAWPVSSDRTTWAIAAWELFVITGDTDWLKRAYTVLKNTVFDDLNVVYNKDYKLMYGESSFLDWREQTYPKWMENADIYASFNLGTNVVHFQAFTILAKMAKELDQLDEQETFANVALELKTAINKHLWLNEEGFYAQYLYGRDSVTISPRFEALGEALAILFDVADDQQAKRIIEESPLTEFGATCIYPQIANIPPYHNNGIWPFVQAYWNLAAAKVGNEKVLEHGLAAIYRPAALFLSNYENMVAETGDYIGTEINSHRMLWSIAGNLAMVHRVFFGMHFTPEGLTFKPVIPKSYGGTKELRNFKYRNAYLDLKINGTGNIIVWVKLDGEEINSAFIPADLHDYHTIEIQLANNELGGEINAVSNEFSLEMPNVDFVNNTLNWVITNDEEFHIYKNGKFFDKTRTNSFELQTNQPGNYQVKRVNKDRYSFLSEPIFWFPHQEEQTIQLYEFTEKSNLEYSNFTGEGFVEISKSKNRKIEVLVHVEEEGEYLIHCIYSNGNGPWNTDNKCALRTLIVNNKSIGNFVYPQRGENAWSDWGKSNFLKIKLQKGENVILISFELYNNNMDFDNNTAMLDCLKLQKID